MILLNWTILLLGWFVTHSAAATPTQDMASIDNDWRTLPPQSNYLLVRQIAYDWVQEVDGRIAIERLDRPAAKPRDSAAEREAALRLHRHGAQLRHRC